MKSPTLSVVLPAHNEAKHIGRQLASIMGQAKVRTQLILCDDGSTDETYKIMCQVTDLIMEVEHLHIPGPPKGVVGATQIALKSAHGDWLYLASANDELQPGAFAAWDQAAKRFPDAQIVCGHPVGQHHHWLPAMGFLSKEQVRHALRREYIHGCATFIRDSAFNYYGGFRRELGSLADFWLYHVVALRHGCVYVPQAIARVGNKQSCHEDIRSAETRRVVVGKLEELLESRENADLRHAFINTILKRILKG